MQNSKKEIQAVGGIIWKGKSFLSAERPEGKFMSGFWEFPGGKIEIGESPEEALVRELQEELGIEAKDFSKWKVIEEGSTHGRIILHLFHVNSFDGILKPLEGQTLLWTTPKEALDLKFLPLDLPVLKELANS